jgi:hypothetical protein
MNHEAAQISVRRNAVESVVMYTQVGHVLSHVPHYEFSGRIEKVLLSRQLKTQQRLAVQKALGPIRPSAGGVFAGNRKNGRPVIRVPAL